MKSHKSEKKINHGKVTKMTETKRNDQISFHIFTYRVLTLYVFPLKLLLKKPPNNSAEKSKSPQTIQQQINDVGEIFSHLFYSDSYRLCDK